MSESDNTDLDDHDSHNEDQLWNKESLKNYMLNALNLLKFSYSTPSETPSVLLTDVIYQIPNKHDKDSHTTDFESWKTVFAAGRLAQPEKIQQSRHQIGEEKDSIIKEKIEVVMKTQQELEFFHQKQLSSESKTHQDLDIHLLEDLFKQAEIDHLRSHAQMNSWFKIEKKNPAVKEQQVLDCMWVYVYKFMKKEMLAKCKT